MARLAALVLMALAVLIGACERVVPTPDIDTQVSESPTATAAAEEPTITPTTPPTMTPTAEPTSTPTFAPTPPPTATPTVEPTSTPVPTPTATPTPLPRRDGFSVSDVPLDPNAEYGGVLQTAFTSASIGFITWESAAGHTFNVNHLLNNMLIKPRTWGTEEDFNNQVYFELHPDLAESWKQSDDGLQYTFSLRDGVYWSDGVPVSCNDIKWSFDTIRFGQDAGLQRSPRQPHYLAVDSIVCPDDLTVVFSLQRPKAAMIEIIGQPYNVIYPAHIYEREYRETGALTSFRELPSKATTGSYILKEWIPGEAFTFERNTKYWDQPLPYLDGVEVQYLTDSAVPAALRNGRVDIGIPHGYTGWHGDTLLAECTEICQFRDPVIASSFSPALFINKQRSGWMADQRINEAFALAIDNQRYITAVRNDWYELPTGCGFHPTSQWAMPRDRCGEIVGFADVVGETRAERAVAAAADKERARELLRQAGYDERNPLEVTWTVWEPIQGDVPAFHSDLEEIGVSVAVDVHESVFAYETWERGRFDFGLHSFWIAGIDPDVILYEHFYTGGPRNYNRYSNPEFDDLVDRMSRTLDQDERKELAWDAMELALSDVAKIIVSHGSYVPAFNTDVRGYMPAINYLAAYGPQLRYDHVWLDR
ncbi:MAG: ABC transporter substrate-binding protein [Dehalococcoidia bacterium]|nr:ABC transporter substrate-binding protein [Dehalococcoidia bacterium]